MRRLGCSALLRSTYNDGVFSNLVWPDCRNGSVVEFMTVRNGVHQWWTTTNTPGFGFETTRYVLDFFDKAHAARSTAAAATAWDTDQPAGGKAQRGGQ